jgi:hypothetical protein
MALLITTDNRPVFLQAREANLLWLVKTGERKGTDKTREKVMKINKWYLNRATAPRSYLKAHPAISDRVKPRRHKQVALPYKD